MQQLELLEHDLVLLALERAQLRVHLQQLGLLGCLLLEADEPPSEAVPPPAAEARATLALFRTRRALLLAPIFWRAPARRKRGHRGS